MNSTWILLSIVMGIGIFYVFVGMHYGNSFWESVIIVLLGLFAPLVLLFGLMYVVFAFH